MPRTEVARRELRTVTVDGYPVPITIYWPEDPDPDQQIVIGTG